MSSFNKAISVVKQGISGIIFPNVCLCCGKEVVEVNRHLCDFCLHRRFEDANPKNEQNSSDVILPNGIVIQHALWRFDKGGALQTLMHYLKYERLTGIGTQLGEVLGRRVKAHPRIQAKLKEESLLLLPVPLHYLKFKKRGFNQAFYIAKGITTILDIPICAIDAVVRKKYTRSQTGFTLKQRIHNMEDAFKVRNPKAVTEKIVIIIDDVFTTGATTFELAKNLLQCGAQSVMIWTVAQA